MTPTVVRASGPDELLETVPAVLGFYPENSLVLMGIRGERQRITATLRIDLPPDTEDRGVAAQLADLMAPQDAEAVMLIVYPPADQAPVAGPRAALPRRRFILEVQQALVGVGISVSDAMYVQPDRWWSYLCTDVNCCPPQGRARPTGPTTPSALTATMLVELGAPAASRQQAVAVVNPVPRPELELLVAQASRAATGSIEDRTRQLLRAQLLAIRAGRHGAQPSAADAATMIALVQHVHVRDAVVLRAHPAQLDSMLALWLELFRVAPIEHAAEPGCLAAALAYWTGSGVVARAAAERVLLEHPGHRMTGYLLAALDRGLPPSRFFDPIRLAQAG